MATAIIMINPLRGKATIYTNVSPTMGDINIYNTLSLGTPLAIKLPQLGVGVQTVGASMLLEKDPNDTSPNTLTFNCYAGDTFADGSTSLVITTGGTQRTLEVVSPVPGTVQWKVIGGLGDAGSSTAIGLVDPSDESPVDPYILTADETAAMEGTRYAQQLPTGTGYGGYGDGSYGYGH